MGKGVHGITLSFDLFSEVENDPDYWRVSWFMVNNTYQQQPWETRSVFSGVQASFDWAAPLSCPPPLWLRTWSYWRALPPVVAEEVEVELEGTGA